jgi:glycosyltransferase involved in cell wall biosynthesis
MTSLFAPPFVAMDRMLWRRLEHVVAISEETRERIVRGGLTSADRIDLAYPGVDLERFIPGPVDRPSRLLAAGRISWLKNLELAIDTVAELTRQGRSASLVIAGHLHPSDETYLAQLRSRADGLPVEFVVRPTDAELTALYRECDLMLFTAINEDFGITPVEAMASGTPVVAVNDGGPRETVDDGRTGWLVDATPSAFAAAITAWRDRGDKAVIRQQARARAEQFNWQAFVDCIDQVMEASVGRD